MADKKMGIDRVLQRKSERNAADHAGHNGSMAGGWKHGKVADKNWNRGSSSMTPRKA